MTLITVHFSTGLFLGHISIFFTALGTIVLRKFGHLPISHQVEGNSSE